MLHGDVSNHYAKTYDINRRSSLLDVKFFNMFEGGLPHDTMHDILEGIALCMEIKLLVSWFVYLGRIE